MATVNQQWRDKTGHVRSMSLSVRPAKRRSDRTDTDTPLKGCPFVRSAMHPLVKSFPNAGSPAVEMGPSPVGPGAGDAEPRLFIRHENFRNPATRIPSLGNPQPGEPEAERTEQ